MTTVMGNDVGLVLDDDDEDENPFVDVSESVEAERAKTTLLPRRHAKKGKAAPKLNTSEPDPSWHAALCAAAPPCKARPGNRSAFDGGRPR